ncbi:hypothetical protein [Bacteroides uniformis]|uniref:hypothetical protein n=1 Tax=Bacteroides uniformis TaxID=820 RepID=UPI00319E400D
MGTSQRHNPSVAGQPNWGKSSLSLSAAIKNLERLDILDAEDNKKANDIDNIRVASSTRRKQRERIAASYRKNIHNAVSRLVKASGGKRKVTSGSSRALGHAGIAVLSNFLGAIAEIQKKGLSCWLAEKGITLDSKSWKEISDILKDLCSDTVVGMDETAANQALSEILQILDNTINNSTLDVEEVLNNCLGKEQLQDVIDTFFGVYIYAHLSQNFEEKLTKKYSQKEVAKYMADIKDLIISDIKQGVNGLNSTQIDWNSEEGNSYITEEFNRIISVFVHDED